MGCTVSKASESEGAVSVDSWLDQLGFGQYASAFRCAGYDDLATLAHLNDVDLDAINVVLKAQQQPASRVGSPGAPMWPGTLPGLLLPGHRKRLLLAAAQLSTQKRAPMKRAVTPAQLSPTPQQVALPAAVLSAVAEVPPPQPVDPLPEEPLPAPAIAQRWQSSRAPLWAPRRTPSAIIPAVKVRSGGSGSPKGAAASSSASRQRGSPPSVSPTESQAPFNSHANSGLFRLPAREAPQSPAHSPGMGSFSLATRSRIRRKVDKSSQSRPNLERLSRPSMESDGSSARAHSRFYSSDGRSQSPKAPHRSSKVRVPHRDAVGRRGQDLAGRGRGPAGAPPLTDPIPPPRLEVAAKRRADREAASAQLREQVQLARKVTAEEKRATAQSSSAGVGAASGADTPTPGGTDEPFVQIFSRTLPSWVHIKLPIPQPYQQSYQESNSPPARIDLNGTGHDSDRWEDSPTRLTPAHTVHGEASAASHLINGRSSAPRQLELSYFAAHQAAYSHSPAHAPVELIGAASTAASPGGGVAGEHESPALQRLASTERAVRARVAALRDSPAAIPSPGALVPAGTSQILYPKAVNALASSPQVVLAGMDARMRQRVEERKAQQLSS